jgi:type II secretory pathway component GspD/PulD (secretin)
VDWAHQVEGYPALSQRIVSTRLKIAEENSIAIAGLLAQKKSRVQSRLPFLGAIPVLGRLFGTTKDQYQETETVIIIKPHILPMDQDQLNIQIQDQELKKSIEEKVENKKAEGTASPKK